MKGKIVFATGGTGGHIFPAIAVAKEMENEIVFIGSKFGMEKKIMQKEKFEYYLLPIKGISGLSIFKKSYRIFLLVFSTLISLYYIIKINPKLIIGFGGYGSFPILLWANLLKKTYFLQEQNSIPGKVTRLFSKNAKAVFCGFPNINLKGKTIYTGNPLRKEFYKIKPKEKLEFPLKLLILGGSQGSSFLNETVSQLIPKLKEYNIQLYHHTGLKEKEKIKESYKIHGLEAEVFDFTDSPWEYYEKADLIICRAGALTVSEVSASGRCAIFIPFKGAYENHQYYNAKYLVERDACFLIEENENAKNEIIKIIRNIFDEPEILMKKAKKAYECGKRDTIDLIKSCILKALEDKNAN